MAGFTRQSTKPYFRGTGREIPVCLDAGWTVKKDVSRVHFISSLVKFSAPIDVTMVTWIGNKFAASIDLEVVGNGWIV